MLELKEICSAKQKNMELTKKILAVILAIIVIYVVLMVIVAILNNTFHPKADNTNRSSPIKIIAAPITQTIPSQIATNNTSNNSSVCNDDAFKCPSGISVGRTGPSCQFVCPNIER